VSRPLLEIEMMGTERTLSVFGLVDSGADMNLFNIRYAQALGITLDGLPSKDFIGISDVRVTTYFAEVPIKVKHFSDILYLPVAFADSPSIDVLLGQEEFFDAIGYDLRKITRYSRCRHLEHIGLANCKVRVTGRHGSSLKARRWRQLAWLPSSPESQHWCP
jgi:hypothetical protein